MAHAQSRRDLHRHLDTIRRFYEVMLKATGNEILAEFLSSQHHRLTKLRSMSLFQPKRAAVSVIEKRRMVAAIKRRDERRPSLQANCTSARQRKPRRLPIVQTKTRFARPLVDRKPRGERRTRRWPDRSRTDADAEARLMRMERHVA
jgi:hypothetical protein